MLPATGTFTPKISVTTTRSESRCLLKGKKGRAASPAAQKTPAKSTDRKSLSREDASFTISPSEEAVIAKKDRLNVPQGPAIPVSYQVFIKDPSPRGRRNSTRARRS